MPNRGLVRDARVWDELGRVDPYQSILADTQRLVEGWDVADFLATGPRELSALLGRPAVKGLPARTRRALDYGCGVGRITRPLAALFEDCYGVDISPSMLERARSLNADVPNCTFLQADGQHVPFENASIDLVYCSRVLQHLPDAAAMRYVVSELLRVLAPGGLMVLQVPIPLAPIRRLQPRRRAYAALRRIGVPPGRLLAAGRLSPIPMRGLDERTVRALVAAGGATVIELIEAAIPDDRIEPGTYLVTRATP